MTDRLLAESEYDVAGLEPGRCAHLDEFSVAVDRADPSSFAKIELRNGDSAD
jgi:hypothetical protein